MANRLDPKLLKKLANKIGKSEKYVREQVSKKATRHRVSSEAYFVHLLLSENIGASQFRRSLSPQIQGEILSLGGESSNIFQAHPVPKVNKKAVMASQAVLIPKLPLLTIGNIKDASENGEIYPNLFLFENSMRTFIEKVMVQRYGSEWWKTRVNSEVQTGVKNRMRKEKLNPWHGSREASEIFYSDFTDLVKILNKNTSDFSPFFRQLPGGLSWLTQRLAELALSRHNIAHSAPLKKRDRNRFRMYFQDWYSQLDQLISQI